MQRNGENARIFFAVHQFTPTHRIHRVDLKPETSSNVLFSCFVCDANSCFTREVYMSVHVCYYYKLTLSSMLKECE